MRGHLALLSLAFLAGCTGSSGSSGAGFGTFASTAPLASPSSPAAATPNAPTISKATHASATAASAVAPGDTITVTFTKEVVLKGATDPSVEFALPVNGNTFGAGATLAAGLAKTDVVITLGKNPNLRISGTFDVASVGSGDASGIDVAATALLATPAGVKAASAPADLGGAFTESWRPAAAMKTPRGGHTATLLDDGRILIVGGYQVLAATASTPASPGYVPESEIFDPVANSFTKTNDPTLGGPQNGDMFVIGQAPAPGTTTLRPEALAVVRINHTAVKLADGRVLLSGGFGAERLDAQYVPVQEELHSSHLFDPRTNTFAVVSNGMVLARQRGHANLLANGTVLIAGGFNSAILPAPASGGPAQPSTIPEGEIYDPVAGTFTPLSSTGFDMVVPRQEGVAVFDASAQQVLFAGGVLMQVPANAPAPAAGGPWQTVPSLSPGAEVFDATAMKFTALATAPAADCRWQAAATTTSGIYILGGSGQGGPNANIDVYSGGAFAPNAAGLATARARAQAAVLGGNIVVVAGGTTLATAPGAELASVEIVNADSKRVAKAPSMANARNSFTLTAANGSVYAIGGFNGGQGQSAASLDGNPVAMAEVYTRP